MILKLDRFGKSRYILYVTLEQDRKFAVAVSNGNLWNL